MSLAATCYHTSAEVSIWQLRDECIVMLDRGSQSHAPDAGINALTVDGSRGGDLGKLQWRGALWGRCDGGKLKRCLIQHGDRSDGSKGIYNKIASCDAGCSCQKMSTVSSTRRSTLNPNPHRGAQFSIASVSSAEHSPTFHTRAS